MDYKNIPRQRQGIERYNYVWAGLIAGIVIPFVGYAVLLMFNEQIPNYGWEFNGRPFGGFTLKLLGLLAICLNLIPFTIFQQRNMLAAMRGVFMPTLLYIIIWMSMYSAELFN